METTTRSDVFERTKKRIVDELCLSDPPEITRVTDVVNDLGGDDLDCVEVIMALEEEFGICIPEDDCDKFCGGLKEGGFPSKFIIGECVDYLCERLGVK